MNGKQNVDSYIGPTRYRTIVKSVRTNRNNRFKIEIIDTKTWQNHYETTLIETRPEFTENIENNNNFENSWKSHRMK